MNASFWLHRARREALRFNAGWWLQMFLPWVMGLGILACVGILVLRSSGRSPAWIGGFVLAGGLIGVVTALWRARKHFLTRAEALVRLDADLRLRNRLSSASQGIGDWPSPKADAALALRWHWPSLVWPPLASLALALAALVIPLPEGRAHTPVAKAGPPAWETTQEKLDALREDELARREAVEEFENSLDALRKQPSDQWFRHESLEASDHLQTQLDQAMADMQKNLEAALGALEASRQIEQSQLQALAQPLDAALREALQGMELGKLPLDDKMLAQLKTLDPSKIRQLSAEEWKALSEKMKKGIGTCSNGLCQGEKAGENVLATLICEGRGGISRGPGAAPMSLKEHETQLGTNKTEAVSNDDLSRAAVGDLMGLGTGEHQVDRAAWSGPQPGGAMSSAGSGGEAVWEQAATPDEQEALRRFFK